MYWFELLLTELNTEREVSGMERLSGLCAQENVRCR